jgi:hypothetical protein
MPDPTSAIHDLDEATSSLLAFNDVQDPWNCSNQHFGHLLGSHTRRRMEAEAAGARLADSSLLTRFAPDPLVLGQHDPASFSGLAKPHLVVGVLREEVVVRDDGQIGKRLTEPSGNLLPSQAPVDEDLRRLAARGIALPL